MEPPTVLQPGFIPASRRLSAAELTDFGCRFSAQTVLDLSFISALAHSEHFVVSSSSGADRRRMLPRPQETPGSDVSVHTRMGNVSDVTGGRPEGGSRHLFTMAALALSSEIQILVTGERTLNCCTHIYSFCHTVTEQCNLFISPPEGWSTVLF